jgi:hypothetical protein
MNPLRGGKLSTADIDRAIKKVNAEKAASAIREDKKK